MYESRVIEELLKMSSTLLWMEQNQPVERMHLPAEHGLALKRLEDMGIVTWRSHHLLSLQKQRLLKLLTRELLRCPKLKDKCLLELGAF